MYFFGAEFATINKIAFKNRNLFATFLKKINQKKTILLNESRGATVEKLGDLL